MATSTKLTELDIEETSGVDHPAHLHEGWLVMKASGELDEALDLADEVTESDDTEDNVEPHAETEEVVDEVEEELESEMTPVTASVDDTVVRKELTDLRKQLEDTQAAHDQLVEERELEKAVETSHRWGIVPELNPIEFAPVLREIRSTAPEAAEHVEKVLDAASVALKEAGILTEIGTDAVNEFDDAYGQIQAKAQDLLDNGQVSSLAKGISQVAEQDHELYDRYLNEKGF